MEIGSAIKTLRKKKRISQKDLAERCGISVNALCQIELNNTFPQKSTIQKICQVLGIPASYLLFFSISDEDIPDNKKIVFNTLSSAIKDVLIQDLTK